LSEDEVEEALVHARMGRFITPLDTPTARRDDIAGFTAGAADIGADFAFDHALIHQVVYAELDRRRRRRLHGEVGHLLEELYHGSESLYVERMATHYLESDDDAKALQYSLMAGDKMFRAYYNPDLALGYYLPALEMIIGKEPALRHLGAQSPVPMRRGGLHRFTPEEREAVVAYLGTILPAVGKTTAAKAIALLANRICVMTMHTGEVYAASIRLYEQCLLGPDVQKLVVETERGKLVGILEFPGPGGPYPVVMLFHGSPGSKEILANETRQYLARGLATVRVDLPGHGETTVPTTRGGADGEILKQMVTAVLNHERVDKQGVGLVGWSYGPWVAAHLCARDERIRAMAAISGRYNMVEAPGTPKNAMIRAFAKARWQAGQWPNPDVDDPFPTDHSAFDVAHKIRCPMLLVYGAMEGEFLRSQNEKLAALVTHAQKKVWHSGVHVLINLPEALEDAAEWMKEQLVGK
jgi:pimeloyl-ACP methyl ester carboxylesterase